MSEHSMRARLTFWYVGALAIVALTLGAGSSWLMARSLVSAADATLRTRVENVVEFIDTMERSYGVDEMRDEIREYAQLATGRAELEVSDLQGDHIVSKPSAPGWERMAVDRGGATGPAPLVFVDRTLGGEPMRVADARVVIGKHTYHIVGALQMAPAYDALARFRWLLAGLVPGVLLVAGLGGYAISRRALAPVDRMTRAARAITVRNLDRRLDVPAADDELRRLAVTFNDMLARLQAAVAEMTRLTAEASHELRTPVALIRATAEVAVSRDRPAADYKRALADVLDHAERLSTLVGDLLTLARSDAGVEAPERVSVDLRQIVQEAAGAVRAAADRASLTLVLALLERPVEVTGQPDSLGRLAVILLDNAIKYSRPGGLVRITVADRSPRGATLEVTDTGIGVDAADRPHVFERFYRSAAARQHAAEGSGLGLAIARTIVDRHGGTISLGEGESGAGCRVVVELG